MTSNRPEPGQPLNPQQFVNLICSNDCGRMPAEEVERLGYQIFYVELHCVTFRLEADRNSLGDWRIRAATIEPDEEI